MSYSPLPITLSIAAPTNGRADSVTSAVRVIVIPFVSEPPAFEAAEASSPVSQPNVVIYCVCSLFYAPGLRTSLIASLVNVRADSVTSAVRVIVIPLVLSAEPPAFEAAEASSPVLRPNAI